MGSMFDLFIWTNGPRVLDICSVTMLSHSQLGRHWLACRPVPGNHAHDAVNVFFGRSSLFCTACHDPLVFYRLNDSITSYVCSCGDRHLVCPFTLFTVIVLNSIIRSFNSYFYITSRLLSSCLYYITRSYYHSLR